MAKQAKKKTSYIIGPIGSEGSEIRAWADFLKEYILTPAVTQCGYNEPERSEKDFGQEFIPMGILDQLLSADLVIADLTNHNPNVFFELGIRHCIKKPVIHLIHEKQKPPFDLTTNRAIFVGINPVRVKQAQQDIIARLKSIEREPNQFYSYIQLREIYKSTPKQGTEIQTRIERRLDFIEQTLQGISGRQEMSPRDLMDLSQDLKQYRRNLLAVGVNPWAIHPHEISTIAPSDVVPYYEPPKVEPAGD